MLLFVWLIFIYICLTFIEIKFRKVDISKKHLKRWNIMLSLPFWGLMSFRNLNVGTDTIMYQYLYEKFTSSDLIQLFGNYSVENGFILFCNVLGKIGINYLGFQIIVSTIIIIGFSSFIYKYSCNYSYSWFVFLTLLSFSRSMNICREMLAVSISFFAIDFLLDKKIMKFFIVVILAFFIHKSAILIILVIPIIFIKSKHLKKILLIVVCMVSTIFFMEILIVASNFIGDYQYLIESVYMDTGGGSAKYFYIILSLGIMYLFNTNFFNQNNRMKIKAIRTPYTNVNYQREVWESYLFLSVFFAFIGLQFGLADRIALYFTTLYIVVIPNSISNEKNPNNRLLYSVGITMVLILYFIGVLLFRNNWHTSLPYSFFWQ